MGTQRDIEAVYTQLQAATTFAALFGTPPTGDHRTQRNWVRRQFAYLAQIVHPDHATEAQEMAEMAFEDLRSLFNAAEKAIEANTYDRPFPAGHRHRTLDTGGFFELKSRTATYRCANDPYRIGDFSVLYRATIASDREVLVKISSEPTNNAMLATEATRLKKFRETDKMKGIHRFLPELIDTFMVPAPDRRQYRANVISFNPAMLSLTDIRGAFPDGLIPQHAAWIIRRVIAQTLAASMAGLVHAAITPDHVLVDPIRHEPCHIGWLHGVEKSRVTMIVDRWKDWYPPEIFAKKVSDHRTDLYMAAKTSLWLFNGDTQHNTFPKDIPDQVSSVLLRCLEASPERRPSDGLKVLTDLTSAIRHAWGRSYAPLMLPI